MVQSCQPQLVIDTKTQRLILRSLVFELYTFHLIIDVGELWKVLNKSYTRNNVQQNPTNQNAINYCCYLQIRKQINNNKQIKQSNVNLRQALIIFYLESAYSCMVLNTSWPVCRMNDVDSSPRLYSPISGLTLPQLLLTMCQSNGCFSNIYCCATESSA